MVLKILALHGSQQNAEVLRTRLGRIVPKVRKYATFSYLDAPHILPLKDGDEIRYRIRKIDAFLRAITRAPKLPRISNFDRPQWYLIP